MIGNLAIVLAIGAMYWLSAPLRTHAADLADTSQDASEPPRTATVATQPEPPRPPRSS
ncbi:MAG: hypothetical protein AAF513_01030 [Pseudomonadota bacterium]